MWFVKFIKVDLLWYVMRVLQTPFLNNQRTSKLLQKKSLQGMERKWHKMAALKLQRLKELIKRSYEAGYNGCMDMADEYADEVMAEIQTEMQSGKAVPVGEWRIFTVEELKKKPVGTLFEHVRLGQGWIDGRSDKDKCMTFQNGEHGYFMQNVEPWDEVMKELGRVV